MEVLQRLPKWAWVVAVLFVAWLLLRSRSAAGRDLSEGQSVAEQLAEQQAKKEGAYNDALRALDLQERQTYSKLALQDAEAIGKARQQYFGLYDALATGKKYASGFQCPDGKPRIDPASGQLYCRTERHKGGIGGFLFGGPQGPGALTGPGGGQGWLTPYLRRN